MQLNEQMETFQIQSQIKLQEIKLQTQLQTSDAIIY